MRFPFELLIRGNFRKSIILMTAVFLCAEYVIFRQNARKTPIIPNVKTVKSAESLNPDNAFVHFQSSNITYKPIDSHPFLFSVNTSILSPHYSICQKKDNYFSYGFGDDLTSEWAFERRKTAAQTKYQFAEADGFILSENLFKASGSNRVFIPSERDLRRFRKSIASEDYVYLEDGWFYKADYDAKELFNRIRRRPIRRQSTSHTFVMVGNPIVSILFELAAHFISSWFRSNSFSNSDSLQQFFDVCKPGDERLRFWIFNSSEISTVAFRKGTVLTSGIYKNKSYGKIVAGSSSARKVMRPVSYSDDNLFPFRFLILFLDYILISGISNSSKERQMNVLLLSAIFYTCRSFIVNGGYLNPALSVCILVGYLILYVKA